MSAGRARGRGRGGRSGATPEIHNPSLPPVRTSQSFGYGAEQTPHLPRRLNPNPDMSVSDMAKNIAETPRRRRDASTEFEQIVESAQTTPYRGRATRASQRGLSAVPEEIPVPPTPKPSARPKQQKKKKDDTANERQKTPDQEQLERELRQASEETEANTRPPVQQQTGLMGPPSRPNTSSSALESVTERSWVTERVTVPDEPPKPTKKTPAKPLTVPQPSPPHIQANVAKPQVPRRSIRSQTAPIPDGRAISNSPASNEAAPNAPINRTRTNTPREEPPRRLLPLRDRALTAIVFLITAILSTMAFLGGLCALGGSPGGILPFKIPSPLCHVPGAVYFGDSSNCGHAINELSDEIDQKLYNMKSEFALAKEELERKILELSTVEPVEPETPHHRVNFFSYGVGSHIIPSLTTPPKKPEHQNFFGRLKNRLVGTPQQRFHQTAPHVALLPWEDIGECWCADGDQIQIGVSLGHKLIPDEIVVEHIHRDETMGPLLAPRHMELWAEYVPMEKDDIEAPQVPLAASLSAEYHQATATATPYSVGVKRISPHYRETGHMALSSSARMYLLDTMRMTYKNEPDRAFSDDPLLGPTFFRIGRWQYDLYSDQTEQRFKLDVVAELPGYRVKNTVVRVMSNWGGDATCIYRVKLHGKPLHKWA